MEIRSLNGYEVHIDSKVPKETVDSFFAKIPQAVGRDDLSFFWSYNHDEKVTIIRLQPYRIVSISCTEARMEELIITLNDAIPAEKPSHIVAKLNVCFQGSKGNILFMANAGSKFGGAGLGIHQEIQESRNAIIVTALYHTAEGAGTDGARELISQAVHYVTEKAKASVLSAPLLDDIFDSLVTELQNYDGET